MYKVSGWASVNNVEEGRPIWEIAAEYLKAVGQYKVDNTRNIDVIGEKDNIGIDIQTKIADGGKIFRLNQN